MVKVAVVTGSRAEFGLLRWIVQRIHDDPVLHLQLIVTGSHLAPELGLTISEIRESGLPISDEVEVLLASDSEVATAKAIGLGVIGLADSLRRLQPSMLVLLGDRFEIFAAGVAATAMRIPIVHLCGGESTEGALDQVWRHGLTKMAHLHLVAAEPFAAAVQAMGEAPERITVVGSPGLESFVRTPQIPESELSDSLGIKLEPPVIVVTFHPVTRPAPGEPTTVNQADALLDVLAATPATYVMTYANADAGGAGINTRMRRFAEGRPNTVAIPSLGSYRYISLLRVADVMVGNSSSGIVEAPSAGLPVVNIGARQQGRLRAPNVIDVGGTKEAIAAGLQRALDPDFRAGLRDLQNPYGDGQTSVRVVDELHRLAASPDLRTKR